MRTFGWKGKEPKDERDFTFKTARAVAPKTCDLRPYCSPIEDQGDLGSCTANSGVALDEFLMKRNKKPYVDMSRLHLYWWTRFIEGTTDEDSGAYIRDTVKAMQKYGVCKESSWPYVISKFTQKPPATANTEALEYQVLKYERVAQTQTAIEQCLGISKRPIIFGFDVPESFMYVGPRGTWTPKPMEEIVGGHAQVLVGYTATRYIMRNSWGVNWGNKGYSTVPKAFILSDMCADFWAVYTAEQM